MDETQTTRPDQKSIFQYTDPLQFILDSFQSLKIGDPKLTVRKWAAQLGLGQPVLLAMILKAQKPLRVKYCDFLIPGLSLNSAEGLFFKTLILRQYARTAEDQVAFDALLASLIPKDFEGGPVACTEEESVFDHWSTLALLTVAKTTSAAGDGLDLESLSKRLVHEVSVETLQNGIRLLLEKGFLEYSSAGKMVPAFHRVATKNDPQKGPIDNKTSQAVHRYYRQVFEIAKEAIEIPVEEREFQCFSLAMSEKKIAFAKELIRDLRNRLAALEDDSADQIYHANLQFFPVTKSI